MSGDASHDTLWPSEWVTRFAGLIPVAATVLDLAAGKGRHTRYFRARRHPVTAVDRNTAPLRGLPGVKIIETDLEDGASWPVEGQFGAVIVTNYLWRPLLARIVASVEEGGVLIYETFAAGNEVHGRPSNPDYLLRPGELLTAARDLRVVAYEHGMVNRPAPAVVQRICATRSADPQPLDKHHPG